MCTSCRFLGYPTMLRAALASMVSSRASLKPMFRDLVKVDSRGAIVMSDSFESWSIGDFVSAFFELCASSLDVVVKIQCATKSWPSDFGTKMSERGFFC